MKRVYIFAGIMHIPINRGNAKTKSIELKIK